jgi:hypothetical protein
MFNSVALDVVIGLVFIYLLYSLLVTILSELIASLFSFRARNLKEAIDRMLTDEKQANWLQRLWETVKLFKIPKKNDVTNAFYDHPEIKYLGSSGLFKLPSSFKADSFSKTLMSMLFGKDIITREIIESNINDLNIPIKKEKDEKEEIVKIKIDAETSEYVRSLWIEAQGDIAKFKLQLEGWFDRTMEHTSEWYKRKIQVVTLVLGLLLAWFFNADTLVIVKNLSNDKGAREQLVSMANTYIESNQYAIDTTKIMNAKVIANMNSRMDTLLSIKGKLETDITRANNILGIGSQLPDSAKIIKGSIGEKNSLPVIEGAFLSNVLKKHPEKLNIKNDYVYFSGSDKWYYFFWLIYHHFFGFLLTAIAISLGAPFWFDLLNKLMSLRTSKKENTNNETSNTINDTVSRLNRVG